MKRLLLFILSITLGITAWSQDEKTCPVGEFHSICVGSSMELALQEGPRYNVKAIADKALMPYVQVYVRSQVLYIELDEKSIPSDVKKLYKGKNAPTPITRVLVSAPHLSKVTGTDNSLLASYGGVVADTLALTGKARTEENLLIKVASPIVQMDKNARASLSYSGEILHLELSGSSECTLSGEAGTLSISGEKRSRLDGLSFNAQRVKAQMKGWSEARVHAEEFLYVNLTGGSALYYTGVPAITIDQVIKSTLAPYRP